MNITITRPSLSEEEKKIQIEQFEKSIIEICSEKGKNNESKN